MLDLMKDLWAFALTHKKFWLLPFLVFLALISLLIVSTQGTVVAPFVYTLF